MRQRKKIGREVLSINKKNHFNSTKKNEKNISKKLNVFAFLHIELHF